MASHEHVRGEQPKRASSAIRCRGGVLPRVENCFAAIALVGGDDEGDVSQPVGRSLQWQWMTTDSKRTAYSRQPFN
ncbi:hypothetical protein B0T26DRAFT_688987 [Lasiosphaeria miniovina]|uniref:Uncharacterized protein n=1 Tax=Lasiosphaeria miniovina TaxID=1954250 RepID=A0AA40EGJ0_9PEZI|nr:uncharacterized protein B0T26DRAFT_688987 [Lasiosphaeria miniovina]KAK0734583.1 hypothetical protein B0T26DRAFT_688987 [Lasiosphaeria miniovina]